jgi:hypothetical protein
METTKMPALTMSGLTRCPSCHQYVRDEAFEWDLQVLLRHIEEVLDPATPTSDRQRSVRVLGGLIKDLRVDYDIEVPTWIQ